MICSLYSLAQTAIDNHVCLRQSIFQLHLPSKLKQDFITPRVSLYLIRNKNQGFSIKQLSEAINCPDETLIAYRMEKIYQESYQNAKQILQYATCWEERLIKAGIVKIKNNPVLYAYYKIEFNGQLSEIIFCKLLSQRWHMGTELIEQHIRSTYIVLTKRFHQSDSSHFSPRKIIAELKRMANEDNIIKAESWSLKEFEPKDMFEAWKNPKSYLFF